MMFKKTRRLSFPKLVTGAMTLAIILIVFTILGNIFWYGRSKLSWEFLSTAPRDGMTAGGIFPAIFGTVALVLLMTVAVIPIGVITAIYLSEYAKETSTITRMVRLSVSNLAGVPSIVFGLFGLGFFVQFLGSGMDRAFHLGMTFSQPCLLWAAMTLAVLNMPVVIVSTEQALRQVPEDYRHASVALGASKWQTIWRVLLPQALPGILTGGILAISRGAGEVAPIMFTGAAYFLPYLPRALSDQFMELGYHVYVMSTQSPDVEATKPILYSTVFVLLVVTFLLNLTAILVRSVFRRRARGTR
jgi:phosphate transport system permease protein